MSEISTLTIKIPLELGEHKKPWGRVSYAAAADTFPSL
jgi:hypothetical protein